jgi:hypothetical protein
MRIFSKFHDYYDTAIGYGIDPNIIYSRKKQYHKFDSPIGNNIHIERGRKILSEVSRNDHISNKKIGITNAVVVFFCGKQYVGIKISYRGVFGLHSDFCYDVEGIKRFYKKYKKILPKKSKNRSFFQTKDILSERNLKIFFKNYGNKDVSHDPHFDYDSPAILIKQQRDVDEDGEITVNPILKDIKFYKCLDSFTTFQELSMFIGGVMGGKVPKMIEINDKDRIAMHGFNEWSFRKESTKK